MTIINRIGSVIVIAVLTSAAWIFYAGITGGGAGGHVTAVSDQMVVNPAGPAGPFSVASITVGPAGLAVPVAGVKPRDLIDTFTQARADGARVHDAIDIMAAEGSPVVSAAPGRVEKLFLSQAGGVSAYVRSDDGRWCYYYAHLSAYAPGLHEGQRLLRGGPVGYVGHTGNASPTGPHLHFAINVMAPGEKWYQGRPVNPYPLLAGTPVAR